MSVSRQDIIDEAQRLVDTLRGRGETHGAGDVNFNVMAEVLNTCGYRRIGPNSIEPQALDSLHSTGDIEKLDALDACTIYIVSKLARVVAGDRLQPDHYHDTAGYGVIAAAIASAARRRLEVNSK